MVRWVEKNLQWTREQAETGGVKHANDPGNSAIDPRYWPAVKQILAQLDGLHAGYNAAAAADKKLTLLQFLWLNLDGDLEDLTVKIGGSGRPAPSFDPPDDNDQLNLHCSGLIRVLPGYSDIYFSHTTVG